MAYRAVRGAAAAPLPAFAAPRQPCSECNARMSTRMSAAVAQEAMLRCFQADKLSPAQLQDLMQRPRIDFTSIMDTVTPIVEDVRQRGDVAVKDYTAKFDNCELDTPCVPVADLPAPQLPAEVTEAFDVAYDNIWRFHEAQAGEELSVETMPGVVCRQVRRPIGAVGVYVPGGTAVLPSSALMLTVPAALAGCPTIVLATPPRPDGSISPEVVYCARKAGATHVLRAGGAQAVAALAHGTASCPKVDKIFGPGNQYVTAAKMRVQGSEAMVAIDMPAGPSEVLVIADAEAPVAHVAADLLSQAEHGPDSQHAAGDVQVVLLALPGFNVQALSREVSEQTAHLPRGATATQALEHSCAVSVDSRPTALRLSNAYAPEHLIINTADAESWLPDIENAGSVFLGRWTPESVGDYASGTNHVLPTYGYARMYSGVNLDAFCKKMTVQSLTQAGLQKLAPAVSKMAEVEGLEAHRRAVTLRLQQQ